MNSLIRNAKIINKKEIINKNLTRYNRTLEKIYQIKIKNLMFHKKSHFTAIFTEYLIWDDFQEFLFELYPTIYSMENISSYINIQYHKFFIPIIINDWGRNLIRLNIKMKKLLISQITDKSKQIDPSKYILKKYSKILPSDLSDNNLDEKEDIIDNSFKTFKDFNINNINEQNNTQTNSQNNTQNNNHNNQKNIEKSNNNIPLKKEISESESTIDNVNANNDISISLDLKINQKYDDKILNQNSGFVLGKNGKNDEELIRMMKYLRPMNTAYIYNNKNKMRTNYIYLDYVNNKTYRLTETTKKTSQNKSEKKRKFINYNINNNNNNNEHLKTLGNLNNINKNNLRRNINCQNYNSKNTSMNKRYNEQKSINANKNNKLYSKSNNKVNNSKINNNNNNQNINNIQNNNIINGYNDLNNKTTSTKTNSYNTTYKNKSENRKPTIKNNRNKKSENVGFITQHNSDLKVVIPFSNEPKVSHENGDNKDISNVRYGSSKFVKTNKKINSQENSKIQTIIISQKIVSNSKDKNNDFLKTSNNNINNVNNINIYGGEIKNFKRNNNNNKILDISSDAKKMKFFISSKDENNNINKFSGRKIIKKEKSLDNKPLNNNAINKPIINQIPNKKNIIIVKRKISDGISTFHKI